MSRHLRAARFWICICAVGIPASAYAHSQDRKDYQMQEGNAANEKAIRTVLASYEASLNRSDPAASLKLYAEDAVVMTPNHETLIGKAAVGQAYEGGSKVIAFDVRFEVKSIVQMAPNWAYARTTSSGTTTNRLTHVVVQEANQEFFLMKKDEEGHWRIAVYSFSSTSSQP